MTAALASMYSASTRNSASDSSVRSLCCNVMLHRSNQWPQEWLVLPTHTATGCKSCKLSPGPRPLTIVTD
jgi:hypothetical protein